MPSPLVYTAGPISGLTYEQCTAWREEAAAVFAEHGIRTASPMRFKKYLKGEGAIAQTYTHPLSTKEGINLRDLNDVRRADGILVNFLGAKNVSIGTVIEIGFATALNKPVVIVMERDTDAFDQVLDNQHVVIKNPHSHPMVINNHLIVHSLEEGVECMASILAVDAPSVPRHLVNVSHPDLILENHGMD